MDLKVFKQIFTPFEGVTKKTLLTILLVEISVLLLSWIFGTYEFLPKPLDIWNAFPDLLRNGLVEKLWVSMKLCLKSMLYATIISAFISYLSTIPVTRFLSLLVTKFRFLSSVGLSFFFTLLSSPDGGLKTSLLVFFITVTFTTSFISTIGGIEEYRYNHARTLRFGQWKTLWEVVILGKLSDLIELMKQNFAIAWMLLTMVEGLVRSEGGIGVELLEANKYLHLDDIFAIQLLILTIGILLDYGITALKHLICPYTNLQTIRR